MKSKKSGEDYFREWFQDMASLHYEAIPLDPITALGQVASIHEKPIRIGFAKAWKRRLELWSGIPEHIEHGDWYLVFMAKALELAHKMKGGAEKAQFQRHIELAEAHLARLHACYGTESYPRGKVWDATPALVRFEKRGDCEYPVVTDACLAHCQEPLHISRDGDSLYIADETDRFHFRIGPPQTVEFHRAFIIFFDFPDRPLVIAPEHFPIIMSWIFSGGYQNVITTAEDALSHRHHQHGATYSKARRMLREALGIGLPSPSERL